MNHKRN
jgi:hypothetical protein